MDRVYIQLQDFSGNWRPYGVTVNNPRVVTQEMENLSRKFPGQRVRAINDRNQIVDIL